MIKSRFVLAASAAILFVATPAMTADAPTAKDPPAEKKSDEQYQHQIDQIGKELDRLEEELKKARHQTQMDLKKRIPELRARQQDLEAKFTELKKSGSAAWKEIAEGAQKAIAELNQALERAAKMHDVKE